MRTAALISTCILLSSCGQTGSQPSNLNLLQGTPQYEARTEPEIKIQGILSFTANPPQSPDEPTSRYTFKTSANTYYFVDLVDKETALKAFLGKNVYVRGKIIDIHINDIHWPNEVLAAVISIDGQGL